MKKYLMFISICVFAVVLFGGTVKAENEITGIWKTVSDEGSDKGKAKSHVEIFEKDGAYIGKVIKLLLKPQDTLCDKCKGDLKNKPVVGMIFLQDMKKTGKLDEELGEEYAGGTIMDPDNGKTYKCKMWVKGDVLTSRGYIGFLYRTQQWFRVK
ncbi:MAG: hypothetical protein A2W27_07170 [Deltaproteobacteria bacterium RBG_16_44_11]|nr:MAG: hypothetical protein A2W27_07170 [Deltaproteobacteria bacterium RBG_16_44_11]